MDKKKSNETIKEIPNRKDPEKIHPMKDPALKPSTENPREPKKDDPEIKS
ncbi:MAG: hypothetical protein V4501_08585 [Pseudomonadota bacterium]